MKIGFLFTCALIPIFSFAQSKQWRDDFSDNKNKWWTGNNEYYDAKIENGYYELNYKTKEKPEKNLLVIKNKLDIHQPWDIEIRIKVITLDGYQNSFGLTVGELDRGNSHYFIVCPNLKMTWWYDYKLYRQTIIKNEPLPLNIFDLDSTTGTKLFLKQRDGYIYFYVNDVYMTKIGSPKTWYGNGVGLFANTSSILRVDYLEIKQY